MAAVVAGVFVDALEAVGFFVMRKPAAKGHLQLGQGDRAPNPSP
jgi:hypothetical protein